MTGALIILAVTVIAGLILYLTRDRSEAGIPVETSREDDGVEECCGRHVVCEKGMLPDEELYYNDEELDRFTGRDPDRYDDNEIEEFREVLYTLRPGEVYSWGRALTRRDIALPTSLRDEWLLLTADHTESNH